MTEIFNVETEQAQQSIDVTERMRRRSDVMG